MGSLIDFTGGIDPADDYPLLQQPENQPTFGENHAFWIFDEDGRFYINTHVNSVESYWPLRRERVHVSLPGGRVLCSVTEGGLTASDGPGGANLAMRCIEPFRKWALTFHGTMFEAQQDQLAAGPVPEGRRRLVHWHADVTTAAPPFRQGGTSDTAQGMAATDAGRFIGGSRYEQLFRAEITFHIEGENEFSFTATGTRTHRRGTRNTSGYAGHDWQSALFPSGDGFYFMRFQRQDGSLSWSEAFLLHEGTIVPATVLSETWITSRRTSGEPMEICLESELGESMIEAQTLGTVFWPILSDPADRYGHYWGVHYDQPGAIALSQGWARYRMKGEAATGLCERSAFAERLRG